MMSQFKHHPWTMGWWGIFSNMCGPATNGCLILGGWDISQRPRFTTYHHQGKNRQFLILDQPDQPNPTWFVWEMISESFLIRSTTTIDGHVTSASLDLPRYCNPEWEHEPLGQHHGDISQTPPTSIDENEIVPNPNNVMLHCWTSWNFLDQSSNFASNQKRSTYYAYIS